MQSIGERLEEARKRKGISIREAAEATKIRGDYLGKFENNQYDIRLPEIYTRGFLRSYSSFLKLPPDKIIADYNALHLGETKSSRSVNREVYGRMDISTSKDKDLGLAHTGNTTPPMAAAVQSADGAPASRNPATFIPPRLAGQQQDTKFFIKIGAIAAAVIAAVILLIVLVSGGGSSPRAQREIWIQAQAGEPVITIVAKGGAVEVKVTSQTPQANGAVTTYYQGTIPAGQSRVLPRREALSVESPQNASVQFIIDGNPWNMSTAKVNIKAP